ncbi:9493_t:CDS:2 [Cetraspora pellucida]|uniref:9493_t:CDS:1 n=1 Tax=Cetraspora pellucida TaxID=1433469 RepID=A0A9N9AHG8_9GLOM|nr:9493_t:CDS:2 [Cetraspora pellucida]
MCCEYSFNDRLPYNGSQLHCTQKIQQVASHLFVPYIAIFISNGLQLRNYLLFNPPDMTGINFDSNPTEFANITSMSYAKEYLN